MFLPTTPPPTWKKKGCMSSVQNAVAPDPLLAALNDFETRLLKYAFSICRDEELAQERCRTLFCGSRRNTGASICGTWSLVVHRLQESER
jgi:hypothetical protein